MQFLVDPVWSWPRVALASAVLLALVLWTYPRRVRHLSAGWRRLLIGLRVAAVVALIFAMLRPAIRFDEIDRQAAQLLVLLDSSRSMTTPDGPGGLTRRQTILKTLEDEQERLAELGEDVDIRFVDFSEEMLPTDEPVEEAEGEYTAIGDVIDELRREDTGKRIVGVVMMSDGAQRRRRTMPPIPDWPRVAMPKSGAFRFIRWCMERRSWRLRGWIWPLKMC